MRKEAITAGFKLVENGKSVPCTAQKTAETDEMMWIRYCPHCEKKMCKYTLQYSISCEWCGWVWL
jgi:hypothetical protein